MQIVAILLAGLLLLPHASGMLDAHAQNSTSTETSSQDAQSDDTETESIPGNSTESSDATNSTETSQDDTDAGYNNTSSEKQSSANSTDYQSEESSATNSTQSFSNSNQTQTTGNSTYSSNDSMNSTSTEQQQNSTSNQSMESTDEADNSQNATLSDANESMQNANSTQTANENIVGSSNSTATTSNDDAPTVNNTAQVANTGAANIAINQTATNQTAAAMYPPEFDIDIDPVTASIQAGSSSTFTIKITSINGFNSTVYLAIKSITPGIIASLSSNMTKLDANASSTSLLTVHSDASAPSGKYKVKISASANTTDSKSASVKIELTRSDNQTSQPEFDPVAFTPILVRNLQDDIMDAVSANQMVLVSTTLVNNYDRMQPFVAIIEVRDKADGATLYLQLQKGTLNPLSQVEIATSWVPDRVGAYELRSFVVDDLKDPQALSATVGKTVTIETVGMSDYDIIKEALKR